VRHTQIEKEKSMSEQEILNIKAAQAFFDAWNKGDLSKATQYEAENFTAEAPGASGPQNAAQNRAYNQNFLTAFPGSKFEVLHTIAQGDYVVTNWKISGTQTGPLQTPTGKTIPPTGKRVNLTGTVTDELKNGKIVHSSSCFDMSSLLGQLGLLPPM
jgi:predicted ester cyclase